MQPAMQAVDGSQRTLTGLIEGIEQSHHCYTREQLEKIAALMAALEPGQRAGLKPLAACFDRLQADLVPHLLKEERILFPYICALESAAGHLPASCFGSVANPIRMMQVEHDLVKNLLQDMRRLTSGYQADPADARLSALYAALSNLDDDLAEHIHQEDDILFPRAVALEADLGR